MGENVFQGGFNALKSHFSGKAQPQGGDHAACAAEFPTLKPAPP